MHRPRHSPDRGGDAASSIFAPVDYDRFATDGFSSRASHGRRGVAAQSMVNCSRPSPTRAGRSRAMGSSWIARHWHWVGGGAQRNGLNVETGCATYSTACPITPSIASMNSRPGMSSPHCRPFDSLVDPGQEAQTGRLHRFDRSTTCWTPERSSRLKSPGVPRFGSRLGHGGIVRTAPIGHVTREEYGIQFAGRLTHSVWRLAALTAVARPPAACPPGA